MSELFRRVLGRTPVAVTAPPQEDTDSDVAVSDQDDDGKGESGAAVSAQEDGAVLEMVPSVARAVEADTGGQPPLPSASAIASSSAQQLPEVEASGGQMVPAEGRTPSSSSATGGKNEAMPAARASSPASSSGGAVSRAGRAEVATGSQITRGGAIGKRIAEQAPKRGAQAQSALASSSSSGSQSRDGGRGVQKRLADSAVDTVEALAGRQAAFTKKTQRMAVCGDASAPTLSVGVARELDFVAEDGQVCVDALQRPEWRSVLFECGMDRLRLSPDGEAVLQRAADNYEDYYKAYAYLGRFTAREDLKAAWKDMQKREKRERARRAAMEAAEAAVAQAAAAAETVDLTHASADESAVRDDGDQDARPADGDGDVVAAGEEEERTPKRRRKSASPKAKPRPKRQRQSYVSEEDEGGVDEAPTRGKDSAADVAFLVSLLRQTQGLPAQKKPR